MLYEKGIPARFRGHGETILLVEDEALVLETIKAMLEHLNYQVLTATNGQEGLAVYAAHKNEISLVVSDIKMPEMEGTDLLKALQAQDPHIKIVMITGYPPGGAISQHLSQASITVLRKPINMTKLAPVVSLTLQQIGG